ncbi:Arc-like DNA binding domain-containing protein [Izhakiella capsodis]|uniref:Arc-like DNA binding domain-containing protein n=1 Tax=Izhakiella capsodis TaxID=1367852 RepID=A0A1I4XVI6_9GAMM|nr:Arc family DNA-binding protein [Izhakiella capsodis]SFN29834.1 Arc-like DNA binding domain-containing protein [Izhakiella capsodis]
MSNDLHSQNRSSRFTLNLPERMRKELEEKAGMDFISLNSAIIMRLAKSLREERANGQ